jgi:hypothetical protein
MNRDKRLKSIFARAFPDHQLVSSFADEFGKKPRNVRRRETRLVNGALENIYAHIKADQESGAGFPIDKQLREFALEYNDRQLGHGLLTMPSSFNVFEGFLEFKVIPPAQVFLLRPEKDHLFSLSDFLDFATGSDRPCDTLDGVSTIPEGLIYNYTPLGDLRDLAFLHADSNRFVVGGATMVRHGDQLHWAIIGGPICDLAAKTAELRRGKTDETWLQGHSPLKKFIKPCPELNIQAEPLPGTNDVWKTVVFGRFNISTRRYEGRYIGSDNGNHYHIITDDPGAFGVKEVNDLKPSEVDRLKAAAEELERQGLLFEIAETLFLLPTYFRFRIKLVREQERSTGLVGMTAKQRREIAAAPTYAKVTIRRIATLEIVDPGRQPLLRKYSPPHFRVEVDGFWRRLLPDTIGKDALGNVVRGRTWVKGHLRWRDRPERTSTIYIKSSIAVAKAKAAAIIASDASAIAINAELPKTVEPAPSNSDGSGGGGWLYVMRCPLMEDDVYKVGWTSKSPKVRAEELSKATGVPLSFIVVESWEVANPKLAEKMAHEALVSFRVTAGREFFKASYDIIRSHISTVVSSL